MDASRSARRTGWPAVPCRVARASCCWPTSSVTGPAPVPRYELEDVLWPEHAPAASDSALSSLLSKLRRALGPGALTGRAELRLALPEPLWVDTEALAEAVELAVQALDDRRWADAAAQARAALEVATEPFLAECDGPWVQERRREVEGLRLRALEALGEAGLRLGGRDLDAAEDAARTAIGLAPFRESAHRLLMEIHEAAGNAAEALRSFDELRRLLRDELGTAPGPQLMALHERLLRGDAPPQEVPATFAFTPAPLPAPLAAAAARGPFVGRADDLATLHEAWDAALADERRLVLLTGEPGIGKSRLAAEFTRAVHAGRRGRALRPLRRDRPRRLPAGDGDAARLVGGRPADPAGAAARPARGRPRRAAAGARRAERADGRAGDRPQRGRDGAPAPVRRARRAAGRARRGRAAAARLRRPPLGRQPDRAAAAPSRARAPAAAHDVPRHLPRRGARGGAPAAGADRLAAARRRPHARRARGPRPRRGRRADPGPRRQPRPPPTSCRRCTARPRATRSSSRRSCATCATRRAASRARSTSRRPGCRKACAGSPRGACGGCRRRRARRSRSRR